MPLLLPPELRQRLLNRPRLHWQEVSVFQMLMETVNGMAERSRFKLLQTTKQPIASACQPVIQVMEQSGLLELMSNLTIQ